MGIDFNIILLITLIFNICMEFFDSLSFAGYRPVILCRINFCGFKFYIGHAKVRYPRNLYTVEVNVYCILVRHACKYMYSLLRIIN